MGEARPARLDQRVPPKVTENFAKYARAIGRYGHVLYAIYAPDADRDQTLKALTAFLDFIFDERGIRPLAQWKSDFDETRLLWFCHLMPQSSSGEIANLLNERHYVILQGPPGTGKTRTARELIKTVYQERGNTIQFHANTTYENFVGGRAPRSSSGSLGLGFAPQKGFPNTGR